ncbi:MAG: hypothetical protein KKF48_00590 [Nanoarchaeota archaeon]|nr:hypothetical protein [Nanoarchaeota archaeon]MBU1027520.1 hypothetical protein [Nanoarchaeota archaeon]
MGIQIEFNPDLALRKHETAGRLEHECLPKVLEVGKIYRFLKKGQRNYWLEGEIPLLETKGNQKLSRPLASIKILEATHFKVKEKTYTRGLYEIKEIYNINNPRIHFEGMNKI